MNLVRLTKIGLCIEIQIFMLNLRKWIYVWCRIYRKVGLFPIKDMQSFWSFTFDHSLFIDDSEPLALYR